MAEDIGDRIVERLEAEGQLIRNTGTNSMKAVREQLFKFDDIFNSINENIINQTEILRKTLELEIDRASDLTRLERLEAAERSRTGLNDIPSRPTQAPPPDTSVPTTAPEAPGSFGGLGSLFGGFGSIGAGGLAGGIAGGLLGAIKTPLKAAILTTLAPTVGKLLGSLTEAGLLELGAEEGLAKNFGEAANLAGIGGMVGLAFGKRMGLVGAAAGAAASFGDDVLDAMGLNKDEMITIFGKEMRLETAAQGVMGALGASVTAVATSPGFTKSVKDFVSGSVTGVGSALNKFPAKRQLLGATIGSAVLGAYITYGDDLKGWIEDQDFPTPVEGVASAGVDVAGMAATGASFGLMFGPQGALAGAAIGFALGIGKTLFSWLEGRKDKARAEFEKEVEELAPVLERAEAGEEIDPEERRRIAAQRQEANRITQLARPEEETTAAQEFVDRADAALGREPLDADKGINRLQMKDRVIGAISGDSGDLEELVQYIKDTGGTDKKDISEGLLYFGQRALLDANDKSMSYDEQAENFKKWEAMVKEAEENMFKGGTTGFQDFGRGSFAVLHGREAVVPEATPAGQFLKNYFDESFQPIMSGISEVSASAMKQVSGAVTYAPVTLAPITNNSVQGGSTSTVINSLGKNTSDLDVFSRPGGVH